MCVQCIGESPMCVQYIGESLYVYDTLVSHCVYQYISEYCVYDTLVSTVCTIHW